jgi:hypothetical protein
VGHKASQQLSQHLLARLISLRRQKQQHQQAQPMSQGKQLR